MHYGVTHLKLRVVVLATDEVYYPRKPALLFYRLFRLLCPSLYRPSWVSLRLLYAFPNEHLQNLQHALEVLHRHDIGLVSHQTPCDFARYCSPCWVGL
jgi:hypothetical protein